MEILTACLCDSAKDYQGKLCILGAFDTIAANELPATHPNCAIALRISSVAEDLGSHQINVSLLDSEGKNLLPAGAIKVNFALPVLPENHHFTTTNCIINLQSIVLPKHGNYRLEVFLDGEKAGKIPLQVVPQN
ncbi:DUF6941 family protein [Pelagicoccus albus]|uniref:Uncharacterized protein n=1 Tax=Pelagicoccus albus TaxID=415222 RepID=A0A7X1B7U5_9BACT|nr:hypothetical protein [Pelagicoccus albus]MBC2607283.1 hypothetical protein [Pelagicoccus albus]